MDPSKFNTKEAYDAAYATQQAKRARLTVGLLVLFAAFAVGVFIVAT